MPGEIPKIQVGLVLVALSLQACTSDAASSAWTRYQSAEVGYVVEFPAAPQVTRKQRLTGVIMTEVEVARLDRGSAGTFQVSHFELADGAAAVEPETLVRIECQYPTADSLFVPTQPRDLVMASEPAVAVVAVAPISKGLSRGGWEENRCVILGSHMVHLVAIGPDDEATRREGQRFLDSFASLSSSR